jgi:hypothetical protein
MEKIVIIDLFRIGGDKETTIGQFVIDGKHECFTIEDEYHKIKQMGDTRIPEGEHELKLVTTPKWSSKMGHPMIWIEVKNYVGVLIHPLNTEKDSDACIGPATTIGYDYSINSFRGNESRVAYAKMYPKVVQKIQEIKKLGKIPAIRIQSLIWNPYDESGKTHTVALPPGL